MQITVLSQSFKTVKQFHPRWGRQKLSCTTYINQIIASRIRKSFLACFVEVPVISCALRREILLDFGWVYLLISHPYSSTTVESFYFLILDDSVKYFYAQDFLLTSWVTNYAVIFNNSLNIVIHSIVILLSLMIGKKKEKNQSLPSKMASRCFLV